MEVEIIKIGSVVSPTPIAARVYDTSQFSRKNILLASDGGSLYEHYISLLVKNCSSDKYNFIESQKVIIGEPWSLTVHKTKVSQLSDVLKGTSDGDPLIGKPYSISGGFWKTTEVIEVISDCVFITKNSVYAIHDIMNFRNRKIGELGV